MKRPTLFIRNGMRLEPSDHLLQYVRPGAWIEIGLVLEALVTLKQQGKTRKDRSIIGYIPRIILTSNAQCIAFDQIASRRTAIQRTLTIAKQFSLLTGDFNYDTL